MVGLCVTGVFYKCITLAILALLSTFYSHNIFSFPSLFVIYDVSVCGIRYHWYKRITFQRSRFHHGASETNLATLAYCGQFYWGPGKAAHGTADLSNTLHWTFSDSWCVILLLKIRENVSCLLTESIGHICVFFEIWWWDHVWKNRNSFENICLKCLLKYKLLVNIKSHAFDMNIQSFGNFTLYEISGVQHN